VIPFEASAIAAVSFSAASLRVFAYTRLSFRSYGRLDCVAGHVESVLAPGDASLAVAALAHA
jgi:hypothetical protein